MRYLINEDGIPFNSAQLHKLRETLDALNDENRTGYRNRNASAIAQHDAVRFLIVSGPGTGKSHLFLDRIVYWYEKDETAKVLVTSFVRKLVADLQSDIDSDIKLTSDQKSCITAITLHKYARRIVEQHRGTLEWPFKPHFRIIGQSWKDIVWKDTFAFHTGLDANVYTWKRFEEQLHNADFDDSNEWQHLKTTYFRLCQFYNAAGFADLILRATRALAENAELNENDHYILDEYQDFNRAEEGLIEQLLSHPKGVLIVGDDEQILYETLKSGDSTLIQNIYSNTNYANGMLPFCGRSSYHITKTADHFIRSFDEDECIEKIYLPLRDSNKEPRVRVVACATPSTAVDYIEKFVTANKTEIDERKRQLESGEAKDAYLLILTPAKEMNFFGRAKQVIKNISEKYQTETRSFSEDYYKLLSYFSLASHTSNNFTFRKVLHYEDESIESVNLLITCAIKAGINLCDLDNQKIIDTLSKCNDIKAIVESQGTTEEKVDRISNVIIIANKEQLLADLARKAINQNEVTRLEHEEEEEAELEEIEVKRMGAVELMTIVGSKGLSADHVIIIGFDNVNMNWVTKNAFYVALTRARNSLHILTALKSGGATEPHSFLDKLPDAHVDYCKYTKSTHETTGLRNKSEFKKYLSNLVYRSRKPR